MTTANNLPASIVCRMLKYSTTLSKSSSGYLCDWKNALALLAICQKWRHAAQLVVYQGAIVELDNVTSDNAFVYGGNSALTCRFVMSTNIDLIKQSKLQHIVKNLCVVSTFIDNPVYFLLCFAHAFSINEQECPRLSMLEMWLPANMMGQPINDGQKTECYAAAKDIVAAVYRQFPDICALDFGAHITDGVHGKLFNSLVNGCGKRLQRFNCDSMSYFPDSHSNANIRSLKLSMSLPPDFNMPIVYPRALKRIDILCGGFSFTWNLFVKNTLADTIQFSQLTQLSIGSYSHYYTNLPDIEYSLELPCLSNLIIINVQITHNAAKYLMRTPLVRLTVESAISDALVLCSFKPDSLNELYLQFRNHVNGVVDKDFMQKANDLFSITYGIGRVDCLLYSNKGYMDISNINWPYLTHLEFQANVYLNTLIERLPFFSNLIALNIKLDAFHIEAMNGVIAHLNNLQTEQCTPYSSNIKKLTIKYGYIGSIKHELDQALETLRWYLPHLSHFSYSEY